MWYTRYTYNIKEVKMAENNMQVDTNLLDLIERLINAKENVQDFNFENLKLVQSIDILINTTIATCSISNIERVGSLLYRADKKQLIRILSTQTTENAKKAKGLLRKIALAATSKKPTDRLRHEFQVALQNLCIAIDILYQELYLSTNLPLFDTIKIIEAKK